VIRAVWNGAVIAEPPADTVMMVEGNVYFLRPRSTGSTSPSPSFRFRGRSPISRIMCGPGNRVACSFV
jgi:hypothetical protein